MSGVGTTAARRGVTWVLCLAGIVLGSVAWSAWVFLHTWADPTTTERVTEAVLADPDARAEVLAPVRTQVRSLIPPEAGVSDAQIDAALDSVLADPAARDRIADAFVGPSGALRLGDARAVFGDEIARRQPGLAPVVQASPPPLALPDLSFADRARDLARTSVVWLALAAIGAFGLSAIFGDPRRTARRFGVWAVSMGLLWVIGPPLAAWIARSTVSSLDATVDVVVHEYTRPVLPWALILTIVGGLAIVAGLVPSRAGRTGRAAPVASAPRRVAPSPPVRRPMTAPVAPTRSDPTRRPTETQEMPAQLRPDPAPVPAPASGSAPETAPTRPVPSDTTRPEGSDPPAQSADDEFDIWEAYESR